MKTRRGYSETVQNAAKLLGAQIRQGRIARDWTAQQLADRAGITKPTLLKAEHGDPSVALGTVFDLAVLVGVPLYFEDRGQLAREARAAQERTALLARRVRPVEPEPDYDF